MSILFILATMYSVHFGMSVNRPPLKISELRIAGTSTYQPIMITSQEYEPRPSKITQFQKIFQRLCRCQNSHIHVTTPDNKEGSVSNK